LIFGLFHLRYFDGIISKLYALRICFIGAEC